MQKKTFEKPKTGVFYLVPDPKNNRYTIYSQFDEDTDSENENLHISLWDSVVRLLGRRFKDKFVDSLEDNYTGLPRGRVMEKGENQWIVAWGKNFSEEYKSDIISEFRLNDANGLGKVSWEFDSHETFDKREKETVEEILEIKITPQGFETSKKTAPKKKAPVKKTLIKSKISEKIINEILKEASIDYRESKESKEFLSKYNISGEDLNYLGSGDFGTAYGMGNNKVLKITSSKSEFELAQKIMKGNFTNFAEIFEAEKIGSDYFIVMEELDIDSDIEDLWYKMMVLLQTQSLPPQYVGNFDEDEYESEYEKIDKDLKEFMDELYNVILDYRKLGMEMTSDIRPENLGRSSDGTLKAFDIDDKR